MLRGLAPFKGGKKFQHNHLCSKNNGTSDQKACNFNSINFPQQNFICNTCLFELQWVKNAAARLVTWIGWRDHMTPALQQLRWLPISYRITYKLGVLMHPSDALPTSPTWSQQLPTCCLIEPFNQQAAYVMN
jgi:hypothetical protein